MRPGTPAFRCRFPCHSPLVLPHHTSTLTSLQPTQWHQRLVHTHTFKVYEYGNRTSELVVEEASSGHSRGRSLEHFFYGIVGHVRDRHGLRVDGWHQSAQLANYRRRHFDAPEDSHPYHDYNPGDGADTVSQLM